MQGDHNNSDNNQHMSQSIKPVWRLKMKNLTTIFLLFTVFAFVAPAHSGSGHAHDKEGGHGNHGHAHGPMTEAKAKEKAIRTMKSLAKRGVIDKSWTSSKPENVEKKTFSKGEEWVVSFKNDEIKDKLKQTLYIFYSLDGHDVAANYTGK